ncbi:hypothetical protein BSNK01_05410 [Bacillaceae bacterium]
MKRKNLRSQFLLNLFFVLLIIVVVSGYIQLNFIKIHIEEDIENEVNTIAQTVQQGIYATNLANKAIEHQIDLKMELISRQIAQLLKDSRLDEITTEQLESIRENLGLAGITLLARNQAKDDIVGVKATDEKDIGFSIKGFNETGYQNFDRMLRDKPPISDGFYSYITDNLIVLPIAQSKSHTNEPMFFKYAYYHEPGTDYIINPYIEADEVYRFTKEVGPESWIAKVKEENPVVEELAVLNPKVFADPSLEQKLYPPLKRIEYGTFAYQSEQDIATLKKMIKKPETVTYIQKHAAKKVYKMFMPVNENQVIYVALDYGELSAPLYRHSVVLGLSGILSLLALYLITARFFNRIYENIQRIITQIKLLEAGDFTAKSRVEDHSELGNLSQSANRMVETLHRVLKDTSDQATKVQRSAVMLEADAARLVEKLYTLSLETTSRSREQLDEILDFLDSLEGYLKKYKEQDDRAESILERIEKMRQIGRERTASVTDMTITLYDLLKSLHAQSSELSEISNHLLKEIAKFKL